MSIQQLSIFVENKQGGLAEITGTLAQHHIDIRALSIADTTDYGILRLIVNRPEEAVEALREEHAAVTLTDVLAVKMPDQPGGLNQIVQLLSEAGVSIEYMYAFLSPAVGEACMVFRVLDNEKAEDVLEKAGYQQMVTSDL